MTLTEFLLARIAEDEEWVRHPDWCRAVADDQACDCDGPARVLAECEAKRRIVERHGGTNWGAAPGDPYPMMCDECQDALWPCPTLRLLALPYADHPDYDEEWRP